MLAGNDWEQLIVPGAGLEFWASQINYILACSPRCSAEGLGFPPTTNMPGYPAGY